MTTHEHILKIVDEHSGGLKFTELMTQLVSDFYTKGADSDFKNDQKMSDYPDFVGKILMSSHILSIVDYHWKGKIKMFVFTP